MKKTAVYTRLSGGKSESSIERQKEDCDSYINGRDDLEFYEWYNEGKRQSGWDSSREEYQRLLQDAQEGKFDVLVVRDGSRIGRDKVERLDTFTDLANKYEVEFHTTKRGYVDPENPTDLLLEVFSATKDDDGKRGEVEAAQEEIQRRVESPDVFHGRVPYGFQYDESHTRLEPTKGEWDDVVDAIERREQGESYTTIADETGINTSTLSRMFTDRLELIEKHLGRDIDREHF